MKKITPVLFILLLFLLAACGGGNAEPTAPAQEAAPETAVEEAAPTEEPAEEEVAEEAETAVEPEEPADTTEEETTTEEPADTAAESSSETEPETEEAAATGGWGDRPMTGIDPETGLEVNPAQVFPGDTFLVRGTIISMNLTPQTSPEFLIQSPDGVRYRLRTQDLAQTFYEDGAQLKPFQFSIGLFAQATASLAADAGPADLAVSDDMVLVYGGEK
jgi:hypothetical protein